MFFVKREQTKITKKNTKTKYNTDTQERRSEWFKNAKDEKKNRKRERENRKTKKRKKYIKQERNKD